jgi:hypothetical protein
VASAKSDLATAQWNSTRARILFKAGAIAERDLKVAEQAVESGSASRRDRGRLKSSSNGTRDTRCWRRRQGSSRSDSVQNGERVTRASNCSVSCATTR